MASEKYDERLHAAPSTVFEPFWLASKREVLQAVDVVVGEDSHESVASLCIRVCYLNMEGVESAAGSGSETCKFKQQVFVILSRFHPVELERLETMALEG